MISLYPEGLFQTGVTSTVVKTAYIWGGNLKPMHFLFSTRLYHWLIRSSGCRNWAGWQLMLSWRWSIIILLLNSRPMALSASVTASLLHPSVCLRLSLWISPRGCQVFLLAVAVERWLLRHEQGPHAEPWRATCSSAAVALAPVLGTDGAGQGWHMVHIKFPCFIFPSCFINGCF